MFKLTIPRCSSENVLSPISGKKGSSRNSPSQPVSHIFTFKSHTKLETNPSFQENSSSEYSLANLTLNTDTIDEYEESFTNENGLINRRFPLNYIPTNSNYSISMLDILHNNLSCSKNNNQDLVHNIAVSKEKILSLLSKRKEKNLNLKKIEKFLDKSTEEKMFGVLSQHFLFTDFNANSIKDIIAKFNCYHAPPEILIFKEGVVARNVFFIEKGNIAVYKKNKITKILNPGQLFGEHQILSILPVNANFITMDQTILWGIKVDYLAEKMLEINAGNYSEIRTIIENDYFFADLSKEQKEAICFQITSVSFTKGRLVIKEDESESSNLYLVKKGGALVTKKRKFIHYLKINDFFGENIISNETMFSIQTTNEILECLSINKAILKKLLGNSYFTFLSKNIFRKALRKNELFCRLNEKQIEELIPEIEIHCYIEKSELDFLFTQSDDRIFIIVIDGILFLKNNSMDYVSCDIIDKWAFMKYKKDVGLYAKTDLSIGWITSKKIEEILKLNLREIYENKFKPSLIAETNFTRKIKKTMNFDLVQVIKPLGEGASGLVLKVIYKKKVYALKIVSKGWIIENKLEKYILGEKEILQKITSNFIVKLVSSFKDEISIYFLLEYISGYELQEFHQLKKIFNLEETVFSAACLILMIEYLHSKGILHRDLKLENIFVDEIGYLKLLDLGFGKILSNKSEKTFTILGTPHFMSPEIIKGKGYSFSADYWALGIIIYFLYFGFFPFGNHSDDTYEIYNDILTSKLLFPYEPNEEIKNILKILIEKNVERRIIDSEKLKSHNLFANIKWSNIRDKKMKSPLFDKKLIPEVQIDNCDHFITLKEIMNNEEIQKIKFLTSKVQSEIIGWDETF